jgi:hypothetical protein
MHQTFDVAPHHIDHIIASKHKGPESPDNLALACANCSLGKGSNIAGRDARTRQVIRLFNPRSDVWHVHFRWRGAVLVGRTAIGRATVEVLNINRSDRIALRQILIEDGLFPPKRDH